MSVVVQFLWWTTTSFLSIDSKIFRWFDWIFSTWSVTRSVLQSIYTVSRLIMLFVYRPYYICISENEFQCDWLRASQLLLISNLNRSANYCVHSYFSQSHNKVVIIWKLVQLRIYTTPGIHIVFFSKSSAGQARMPDDILALSKFYLSIQWGGIFATEQQVFSQMWMQYTCSLKCQSSPTLSPIPSKRCLNCERDNFILLPHILIYWQVFIKLYFQSDILHFGVNVYYLYAAIGMVRHDDILG